jgi:hypothetical protein
MNIIYIPDREINLEKGDLLGAEPYVNTLSEIITKSNTPFTIGLFGGWGVGKSSIIETIKEKFNNDEKSDVAVFKYDAWKYSNDSFRRTFLYELKEFFKLGMTDSFESFYEDRSEDIDHKLAVKKYSFWWWLTLSPLLLILVWLFPGESDLKISTTIISIILTVITTLLRETFVQYKVTISKQKIFAPEQFEKIFSEVIDKVINKPKDNWEWVKNIFWKPKKKVKKLVIVIDNIDRCHKDLAFELLLTIKNFLEQKGVVFIIPIDEVEIKKHIKQQGNNPNEFLRKLFNTTISIKNISEGDLFGFAKKLNDDYKLNFSVEIISIVAQQFSKNPRKIIQFLNVFQTEILLSKNQESENLLPTGSITDNLPFVTKLLILREEWPDLYNKLKSISYVFGNLYSKIVEKNGEYYIDEFRIDTEQRNFLRRTNHIKPNHKNFELFFINKDSFKDIPDKTNNLVESNDIEGIKEQLNNNEIKFDELIEFIDDKFETALSRGEIKTTIVAVLSLVFSLSIDNDLRKETEKYLYNSSKFLGGLKNFIGSQTVKEIIEFIDNKILLGFIKEYDNLSQNILQNLISIINENEDSEQILLDYVDIFKNEPKKLKEVSKKFSTYLSNDSTFAIKAKPLLNEKVIIENLIESKLIDEYIEKVVNEIENEDSNQKLELISLYNVYVVLSDKQINDVTTKLVSYINSVNDFIKLPFWFSKLNEFVSSVKDSQIQTNIYNSLNAKQTWLWQQYSPFWNKEEYQKTLKLFIENITNLYCSISNTNQEDQIIAWLNQYLNRNESQELIKFINNQYYSIIKRFNVYTWPYAPNLITRFTQITDWETKKEIAKTLNLMLSRTINDKGLNEQQIQTVFTNYINLINEENQEEVINWISKALKNALLMSHFESIINIQSDERKFELLNLLAKLNKNELIEDVLSTIIRNIECDKINTVFERIENEKVSKEIVIKSIKTVLKGIERENGNFDCLIEFISRLSYSDNAIYNLIAEKIKNLLATDNNDDILFSLRIIDNLKISDTRKLSAIKTLIQDINESGFEDEDLKFVKKMKKKYE